MKCRFCGSLPHLVRYPTDYVSVSLAGTSYVPNEQQSRTLNARVVIRDERWNVLRSSAPCLCRCYIPYYSSLFRLPFRRLYFRFFDKFEDFLRIKDELSFNHYALPFLTFFIYS
jgi:hypothetical protein